MKVPAGNYKEALLGCWFWEEGIQSVTVQAVVLHN
jgi:hypothetical protein